MKRFLITSAGLLLGSALLATAGFAQTVPPAAPPSAYNPPVVQTTPPVNPPVSRSNGGVVIIQGPYFPVSSQMGDLRLMVPGTMLSDSVYVDGSYVGVAAQVGDMQMPPGAHELFLCAPDGTPVYRHNITIGTNEMTEVRPFAATDSGVYPQSAQEESGVVTGPVPVLPVPQQPVVALPPNAPPAAAYVPQPEPATGQGDLRLNTAYALRNDAVFIDGTYVGIAKKIHDLELTPGGHEIALCAPNGITDFVDNVGISLNGITRVRPSLERSTQNG